MTEKGFLKMDCVRRQNLFIGKVSEQDGNHFGLGLNICKVLCEKHGGSLSRQIGEREAGK